MFQDSESVIINLNTTYVCAIISMLPTPPPPKKSCDQPEKSNVMTPINRLDFSILIRTAKESIKTYVYLEQCWLCAKIYRLA